MNQPSAEWESQVANLWASLDRHEPDDFVRKMDELARQVSAGHPSAIFERACAQDSTGHSDRAVPLYRQALAAGLDGVRRRRATIQLASSLRNVGQVEEAVTLLSDALRAPPDELSGAVRGFLALALADLGREREALMHSLTALATYLPRYNRSLANYAFELVGGQRT